MIGIGAVLTLVFATVAGVAIERKRRSSAKPSTPTPREVEQSRPASNAASGGDRSPSDAPQIANEGDRLPSDAPQMANEGDRLPSNAGSPRSMVQTSEFEASAPPSAAPSDAVESDGNSTLVLSPCRSDARGSGDGSTLVHSPHSSDESESRDDSARVDSPDPPDPPTRNPRVLRGGLDGGGSQMVLDVPVKGWSPVAAQLLDQRPNGVLTVEGVEVHVRRSRDGGVRLHAPRRASLVLDRERARLVMPQAAVERVGVSAWLDRWPEWASRILLGLRGLSRDELHAAGWQGRCCDVHVDVTGIELDDAWMVQLEAWAGRSTRRRPHPDAYHGGRLTGAWIGAKVGTSRGRATATSLHWYNKSLQQAESAEPSEALLREYAELGHDETIDGPVWRFEFHLAEDALRLVDEQSRVWDFRDPATWASTEAVAVAWAYATTVIRLTDPDDPREARRRRLHPLWELLRSAAPSSVSSGGLKQARSTVELERSVRKERAEARVGRALGQLAGVVGAAHTPDDAGRFAVGVVPQIVQRNDWSAHVAAGRVDNEDLRELERLAAESESESVVDDA